jgi:hypothetical protein
MKKTQDDYINDLKKDLDKGNNFVDYFITIGLKEEAIFSDFLYKNDLDTLNKSPLTKPDITSKFPPIDKTIIGIDESLIKVYSIN